ncbi:MAG: hypothetical protein ACR2K2_04410 [Mycobacteriales bacterium]
MTCVLDASIVLALLIPAMSRQPLGPGCGAGVLPGVAVAIKGPMRGA